MSPSWIAASVRRVMGRGRVTVIAGSLLVRVRLMVPDRYRPPVLSNRAVPVTTRSRSGHVLRHITAGREAGRRVGGGQLLAGSDPVVDVPGLMERRVLSCHLAIVSGC